MSDTSPTSGANGIDPWELVRRASRDDVVGRPSAPAAQKTCTISDDALGWVQESQIKLSPEAIANLSRPTPHSIGLAARAAADAGVDLRTSLARAHASSVADTKTYIDAYVAYTATRPELAALHARAMEDGPELLDERQALEDERQIQALERSLGERQAQDTIAQIATRPPAGVVQLAAVGEVAIPVAEVSELALAIAVPEAGAALSVLEAATGRSLGGLGHELSVDERVLGMALAMAPAAGKIIGAGAKGAEAVVQIARQTGRNPQQIVALLRELQTIGRQEKLLTQAMELKKAGRPLLPIHEAALNRTVRQLCRAQGFTWTGEKVVLRSGGALPPLKESIPAEVAAKLTPAQRGMLEVYLRRVEETCFVTRKDSAIFYTGAAGKEPAWRIADREVAASGGKKQVISSVGGEYFNGQNLSLKLTPDAEKLVWTRASKKYAEGASGNVQFIGDLDKIKRTSVFYETELPALLRNPNISDSTRQEVQRIRAELEKRFK